MLWYSDTSSGSQLLGGWGLGPVVDEQVVLLIMQTNHPCIPDYNPAHRVSTRHIMQVAVGHLGERRLQVGFRDNNVRDKCLGLGLAAGEDVACLHDRPVPGDHWVEGEGQEVPRLQDDGKEVGTVVLKEVDGDGEYDDGIMYFVSNE